MTSHTLVSQNITVDGCTSYDAEFILLSADDWLLGQVQGKDPGTIFDGPQIVRHVAKHTYFQAGVLTLVLAV